MGRFQQQQQQQQHDGNSSSEKVVKKRRCTVSTLPHRENWAKRMSSSSSDLLEDNRIGSLEGSHMTISTPPRRRPNNLLGRAGSSMPVLLMRQSLSVAVEEGAMPQLIRCETSLPPCLLPRFSRTAVINKEDMECRLEEFRARMLDRQRSSSSSCYRILALLEEELAED